MFSKLLKSLIILALPIGVNAQIYAEANFLQFAAPKTGTYLETILSIDAGSLVSISQPDSSFSRGAGIGMLILNKKTNQFVFADKYTLMAPKTKDSIYPYMVLDVRRIPLKNGEYEAQLFISDLHNPKDTLKTKQTIQIEQNRQETFLSDILLVESMKPTTGATKLTKSGYDIIPFTGAFYPKTISTLTFYVEAMFNEALLSLPDKNIVFQFFIENADSKSVVEGFSGFSRQEIKEVNMLCKEVDIQNLGSGNYNLVIQVKNVKNEILAAKSTFFQRSNPAVKSLNSDFQEIAGNFDYTTSNISQSFVDTFTNVSLLADCIKSLYPISTNMEQLFQRNQLNLGNLELMKHYMLAFWESRDKQNPDKAWADYFERVRVVVKNYSTQIQRGYDTDRGRVYLQYGAPNTMDIRRFEPNSYPYEIWHYYQIPNTATTKQQSNKKFVFYAQDRSTNDYKLLHSTAIGEIYDQRWQMRLNARSDQSRNLDYTQPIDEQGSGINSRFGSSANDLFNNPR
ncbi:MAG: GWxTD domain-containing protein [Bacteroidia bacterium]|nr:GWxTD domain-containing protein [Bacteroidia bacterium]